MIRWLPESKHQKYRIGTVILNLSWYSVHDPNLLNPIGHLRNDDEKSNGKIGHFRTQEPGSVKSAVSGPSSGPGTTRSDENTSTPDGRKTIQSAAASDATTKSIPLENDE